MDIGKIRTYFIYTTEFFTGASILVLEILGTRIISPFYGDTIFVWTSLIVVTLGALALGYFLGGRFSDKMPFGYVFYSIIFIAALFFLLPIKIDQWVLPFTDQFGFRFGPLVSSFIMFFTPLFLLGMASPFAIKLVNKTFERTGSSAGSIFAISTVGSIFGGFLAGFYLIDKMSISSSLLGVFFVLIIVSMAGLFIFTSGKKKAVSSALVLVISFLIYNITPYEYKDTYTLQIHHHSQSFYADLKVIEIGLFECLAMNGSFQSCFNNRKQKPTFTFIPETERIVGLREPKNMLVLGMGTGNILDNMPDDLLVDLVEIDEKLLKISEEYFGLTKDKYNSITFDDARHFLSTNNKKYDIILVDTFLGSSVPSHMYTKESMGLLQNSLADGGLILINAEGKLGDKDEQIKTIMKTVSSLFPRVILTTTETDRFTSILLHVSMDKDYVFEGGGQFVQMPIDYKTASVMTDDFNSIDIISIPKLQIFRDEMINVGGMRLLFST